MYLFKDELEVGDVEALDKLYRSARNVYCLQHPLWPDDLGPGQRRRFFLQVEDGEIVLYTKIIESKLGKAPFVNYALNRGGFISGHAMLVAPAIGELVKHYRQQKFARFTAEQYGDLQDAEYTERSVLKERLVYSHNFTTGARTSIQLPLAADIEKIYDSFSAHLKRNIAKAQKKKVTVRAVSEPAQFEPFLAINKEMEDARGMHQGSDTYLRLLFRFIQTTGLGYFLASYDETGRMIGGIFLLVQGLEMLYLLGATHPEYRHLPQSHLTFWEAIQLSKREGSEVFDFGGFGFNEPTGSQIDMINQFKLNFSDNVVFYPKSMTFETNRLNAWIGDALLKLRGLAGR